jgi:hypothetical protein
MANNFPLNVALRAFVIGLIVYTCCLVIWRLFFHPLRKIPGPKLAAITYWYEFYQDVILQGNYVKVYPDLHKQYGTMSALDINVSNYRLTLSTGPVVRVSPDRVHINDPEYFHE